MYDLVIRNATIVDGTGKPAFPGDLGIANGKIIAVGEVKTDGSREIDAKGKLLTPGWVDVHSHMDGQATWDPLCSPAANHGITTLIMGNCGIGFAPCEPNKEAQARLITVVEDVEDIPGAALHEGVKWDWESFPEYLDAVEKFPRAIDVGAQVPHCAGWQDYSVSNGNDLMKLDPRIKPSSYALGVLGMPGLTAYVGLLDIGDPKPGETVVLAASTGAVGSVVGQIAKLKGCRVVGIAGAKEKCAYAVDVLGYDACISHYDKDMGRQLVEACPDGIDVYFENVGGSSWEAVMPLLNNFARVPICGLIAHYNQTELPPGPDRVSLLQGMILQRSLKMQGFIVSNYRDRIPAFIGDMSVWLAQGKIKYREDVVDGLENAPEAFLGFFSGANFGKLVVRVS